MKLTTSVCIEAPKAQTWKYLSDLERASDWVDALVTTKLEDQNVRALGAIRVCTMTNGDKARELFTAWSEGSSFTYEVLNAPMVKYASNAWSIVEVDGKSLVTSRAILELKGGIFGKAMGFVARIVAKRSMMKYLAAFKYLVENGRVYEGKSSDLPRISFTC